MRHGLRQDLDPALRSLSGLAALLVLLIALPFTLCIVGGAALTGRRDNRPTLDKPRNILISGGKMTKALQLARAFHRAGHRVVLTETYPYRITGHRFSNAVARFRVTPDPDSPDYIDAIRAIVVAEGIDLYVPVCSPVSSVPDARVKAALAGLCEVLHCDLDTVQQLDDKNAFSELARHHGLSVPASHRITDPVQVTSRDFDTEGLGYILKSVAYDPVRRLDLTRLPLATPEQTAEFVHKLPISSTNPWSLQEFIEGTEYCTHSTVRNGRVTVYACCLSSASQLNYAMVQNPKIKAWVEHLVSGLGLTGQVSFDFIETADGRLFAIECNPRTHSAITMFYNHPDLAHAYLDDGHALIEPRPDSRPTYWVFHELFEGLTRPSSLIHRLRTIGQGKEAIFDRADPLPFLMVHHVHIPILLVRALLERRPWVKIDFNIGKLVAPAGD